MVTKYNRFGMKQERAVMITNKKFYNVHKKSNPLNWIAITEVNRKILIASINGLTMSSKSDSFEFVIHVRDQYDYRFMSTNFRDIILDTIKKL